MIPVAVHGRVAGAPPRLRTHLWQRPRVTVSSHRCSGGQGLLRVSPAARTPPRSDAPLLPAAVTSQLHAGPSLPQPACAVATRARAQTRPPRPRPLTIAPDRPSRLCPAPRYNPVTSVVSFQLRCVFACVSGASGRSRARCSQNGSECFFCNFSSIRRSHVATRDPVLSENSLKIDVLICN